MCSQVFSHAGIYRGQRWVRYFPLLLSPLFHDIEFFLVTSFFFFRVKWTAGKILVSFCLLFQCWTPTMYHHSKIFICVGYLNSHCLIALAPVTFCHPNGNVLVTFYTSVIKYLKRKLKSGEICLRSWFKWLQLIAVGHQALEHLIR